MKVVEMPIEMICSHDSKGYVTPIKFKIIAEDDSEKVIKIYRVMTRDSLKIAGKDILVFTCIVILNDTETICEIRFIKSTMQWLLYKI